ncbi:hypothetical protein ACX4MT_16440 [Roseomonas mucosa]
MARIHFSDGTKTRFARLAVLLSAGDIDPELAASLGRALVEILAAHTPPAPPDAPAAPEVTCETWRAAWAVTMRRSARLSSVERAWLAGLERCSALSEPELAVLAAMCARARLLGLPFAEAAR